MRKIPRFLATLGLITCSGLALAATAGAAETGDLKAGDPARGAAAAAVCTACHQADGSGKQVADGQSWPRLAGLDAAYMAKQLHDFQSGQRSNATMMPFAQMLSEQQIVDVVAYYASLPATPGLGGEDAAEATLKRGEQLAERGDWSGYIVACKSCHGPRNQGAGEVFPGIAGQHAGYIKAQLQAWKAGARSNDTQDLMGSIARRMGDDDIHAVAVWLANQTPATH